ncbi:GAF domain-containing protein [Nocardia blacklockiae]|uniref:GAF domain-containing protein n=1 Tax=Nocardia blacklockiae TaxID=480036 RepID=UPI0018946E2F|nr:GAF domain-containing protein [Nocardia blacklockiae]MBF6171145.1 DUF5593 domain-containing protein [Nocardia blacklockiae]
MLVDTFVDSVHSVIAEGVRPRAHSRLGRTRMSGTGALEQQIAATVARSVVTRRPQTRTVALPSGVALRCFTVPVLGPDREVHAVHAWAGPRTLHPPQRPAAATLTWNPRTGVATTSPAFEQLLGAPPAATRILPDLVRHLDLHPRPGLLELFGDRPPATTWIGTGIVRGTRHVLRVVAHRVTDDIVRAVVHRIDTTAPDVEPITAHLVRHLPVAPGHAIGLVDLRTGLVHEWVIPGPPPLHRWREELPQIHDDDRHSFTHACARLLDNQSRYQHRIRLRFADTGWLAAHARWNLLAGGTNPQALLDLHCIDTGHASRTATPGPPRTENT